MIQEKEWTDAHQLFEERFGEGLDVQAIIFLIGVQELGMGSRKFSKDEKLDVMHIAICKILSYYGFYEFVGTDNEGWPHWDRIKRLPALQANEQEEFMKRAIVNYLNEENYW